jgi:hypothetical protein
VADYLREHFVTARINTEDRPDLCRRFDIFWSPTLVTLHHLGHRLRDEIGYLPPRSILAELILTRGLYALRSARAAEASALFRQVVGDFADMPAAAEALYWHGVAAYRVSKNKDDLWTVWRELVAAYPTSVWTLKTTLVEP